ncbi:hypothetical protein YC2023_001150 [Brassica napus]
MFSSPSVCSIAEDSLSPESLKPIALFLSLLSLRKVIFCFQAEFVSNTNLTLVPLGHLFCKVSGLLNPMEISVPVQKATVVPKPFIRLMRLLARTLYDDNNLTTLSDNKKKSEKGDSRGNIVIVLDALIRFLCHLFDVLSP